MTRVTQSAQASYGGLRVASFIHDTSRHGVGTSGDGSYRIPGSIPAGSLLIHSFWDSLGAHVIDVDSGTTFRLVLRDSAGAEIVLANNVTLNAIPVAGYGLAPLNVKITDFTTWQRTTKEMFLFVEHGWYYASGTKLAFYVLYVNDEMGPTGQYVLLGGVMRHRTEFPQGYPFAQVRTGAFVWDSDVDPLFKVGLNLLTGEVPAGSIVVGGFLQVGRDLRGSGLPWSLSFMLGEDPTEVLLLDSDFPEGWYPLAAGQLWDVTRNFPVSIDYYSHLRAIGTGPVDDLYGQFALYLCYVNNELGLYGQLVHPDLPLPPFVPDFPEPPILENDVLLDTFSHLLFDDDASNLLLDA